MSILENVLNRSSNRYNASKRDPRYANAKDTCLWDLVPLLDHFHPTVKLLTQQLLSNETLTTAPDLTLYSLSHFLDKFVYRNPKKKSTLQKGASGMQPAVAAGSGIEDGVRRVKGWSGTGEEVNTVKFWKQKAQDVPVDSLFFHKYFNLREDRTAEVGAKRKKRRGDEDEESEEEEEDVASDGSLGSDEVDAALQDKTGDAESDSEAESDDTQEREIWAAMKRTMPAEDGDEDLSAESGDDEDDDEDLDMYDYTDEEEEEKEEEEGDVPSKKTQDDNSDDDDDEAAMFEEDEDDLLPFANFGSEVSDSDDWTAETQDKGKKRTRPLPEAEETKSKSQLARQERKKRKGTSTFASAEEYALLIKQAEEEEEDF